MRSLNHNTLGIVFLIGFLVLVGITLFALKSLANIPPVQKIKFEHGYKLEETTPQADGRFHGTARISSAPVYYKKNGVFVSFQAGFVDSGNGTFVMADAPINVEIPKGFNGTHRITSDNGKVWQMNPIGANNSQGTLVDVGTDFDGNHQNKLVFTDAFTGVDVEINPFWGGYETNYTIKDSSVKNIHFNAQPEGNALVTHGNGALDVQQDGAYVGFIPQATAHDKNGFNVPVTEIDTTVGAGKLITYTVNATSSTQYPIKLDPLVRICSTSISGPCQQKITVDGILVNNPSPGTGVAWSTIRSAANATSINQSPADPGCVTAGFVTVDIPDGDGTKNDLLNRVVIQFDTGSVGATSFSSSSMVLKENGQVSTNSAPGNKIALTFVNSSSTAALITTDYANASDTRAANLIAMTTSGVTKFDDFLIYATQTTNYVSPTTTTKIMLRGDNDTDNFANTNTNTTDCTGISMASTASTADSPQLIADYTVAGGASFNDDNSSFMILIMKTLQKIFAGAIQAYIPS